MQSTLYSIIFKFKNVQNYKTIKYTYIKFESSTQQVIRISLLAVFKYLTLFVAVSEDSSVVGMRWIFWYSQPLKKEKQKVTVELTITWRTGENLLIDKTVR